MKEQNKKFNYIRKWPVSFTSFFPLILRGKCKLKYIEIVAPFPKTRSMYLLSHPVFTFSKPLVQIHCLFVRLLKSIFFSIGLLYIFVFFEYFNIALFYFLHPLLSVMFLSITYGKVDTFQAALEVKQQTTGQQDYQFCFLASWSRH